MVSFSSACKQTPYAIANILTGFAFICSAVRRFILSTYTPFSLTPLQCLIQAFYLSIYVCCDILGVAIPVLISFDRFIAVMSYRLYSLMTLRVACCLLGLVTLTIIADLIYCWISVCSLPDDFAIPATCTAALYSVEEYDFFHRMYLTVLSYCALAFYAGALMTIVCRRDKENSVRAAQMKREAVITRRLSYLILLTLFFQTLPLTLSFVEIEMTTMAKISIVIYVADVLNMSTFVLIFSAINPELRKGFLQICCRKRASVAGQTK
uniref:G-protein coupled receptors family 1 profile domain-containing protein n=1 Tax=Trichuris muris TaxID=70415 RepID=A0A5S6QCA6_TRIMR